MHKNTIGIAVTVFTFSSRIILNITIKLGIKYLSALQQGIGRQIKTFFDFSLLGCKIFKDICLLLHPTPNSCSTLDFTNALFGIDFKLQILKNVLLCIDAKLNFHNDTSDSVQLSYFKLYLYPYVPAPWQMPLSSLYCDLLQNPPLAATD